MSEKEGQKARAVLSECFPLSSQKEEFFLSLSPAHLITLQPAVRKIVLESVSKDFISDLSGLKYFDNTYGEIPSFYSLSLMRGELRAALTHAFNHSSSGEMLGAVIAQMDKMIATRISIDAPMASELQLLMEHHLNESSKPSRLFNSFVARYLEVFFYLPFETDEVRKKMAAPLRSVLALYGERISGIQDSEQATIKLLFFLTATTMERLGIAVQHPKLQGQERFFNQENLSIIMGGSWIAAPSASYSEGGIYELFGLRSKKDLPRSGAEPESASTDPGLFTPVRTQISFSSDLRDNRAYSLFDPFAETLDVFVPEAYVSWFHHWVNAEFTSKRIAQTALRSNLYLAPGYWIQTSKKINGKFLSFHVPMEQNLGGVEELFEFPITLRKNYKINRDGNPKSRASSFIATLTQEDYERFKMDKPNPTASKLLMAYDWERYMELLRGEPLNSPELTDCNQFFQRRVYDRGDHSLKKYGY